MVDMFIRQDDRNWENVPTATIGKDFLRELCSDCMTERFRYGPFSDKKRKARTVHFSPYGPGGVVDIIINNKPHHPEWAFGFSVENFTQSKKGHAVLSTGGRFEGLQLYEKQNLISVRLRRYAPDSPFRGPSTSFTEYLLRFSFNIRPHSSMNDPLEPNNRQLVRGMAALFSVARCEGDLIGDSFFRRGVKLDKAIEVQE